MSKPVETKHGVYVYQNNTNGRIKIYNNLKALTESHKVSYNSLNNWFRRDCKETPYVRKNFIVHNEKIIVSKKRV